MSTSYGGTPPGITGTHYGGAGLGCPGSLIPSEGLDGAGYLFAGLSLPADAAKEIRGPITRWPAGTLTVLEDSAFTYTGATDFALFAVYVDGVASSDDIGYGPGVGRIDLGVGLVPGLLEGDVRLGDCVPGGGMESLPAVAEVFTAAARTRIGSPTIADALERIGSRTTAAGLVARVGGKRI